MAGRKLTEKRAAGEAASLRAQIERHDRLYAEGRPEISDAAYDRLFARLRELERKFPEIAAEDSPTRRVGGRPAGPLKKSRHRAPMLSLETAREEKEAAGFFDSVRRRDDRAGFVLEPKFDGISVEAVYGKGRLKSGSTRGDGQTGDDITRILRTVPSVPSRLKGKAPRLLSARCEIFMPRDGFRRLNKERLGRGEEPFANPRNAAAGLLRQLEPDENAGRVLEARFYDALALEGGGRPSSHWALLGKFRGWGLPTDRHNSRCGSFGEAKKVYGKLREERDDLSYEIDGMVVKTDDLALREELGVRDRSPRWALAWKFPPREEVSRVEEIAVQVGRTGVLTPVALLAPVDVGGVTISRATLHNEGEIGRKDIREGDKVRVVRAGDVIPEVAGRVKDGGRRRGPRFSMPSKCPSCGTRAVREGAFTLCPAGLSCKAQLTGRIAHYASREALDIDGLSVKTAGRLVEKGLVRDVADLYGLGVEDILSLEGFARRSAAALREAIENSKNPALHRFLYALGIGRVGRHTARSLAQRYLSLDALLGADRNELARVPGVGKEAAASLRGFFGRKENRKVLDRLRAAGVKPREPRGGGRLEGKTLVFTGSLKKYSRPEAKRAAEAAGAEASSSVSGRTDLVVAGKDPGSKLASARDKGVKVIREKDFEKLLPGKKGDA